MTVETGGASAPRFVLLFDLSRLVHAFAFRSRGELNLMFAQARQRVDVYLDVQVVGVGGSTCQLGVSRSDVCIRVSHSSRWPLPSDPVGAGAWLDASRMKTPHSS